MDKKKQENPNSMWWNQAKLVETQIKFKKKTAKKHQTG